MTLQDRAPQVAVLRLGTKMCMCVVQGVILRARWQTSHESVRKEVRRCAQSSAGAPLSPASVPGQKCVCIVRTVSTRAVSDVRSREFDLRLPAPTAGAAAWPENGVSEFQRPHAVYRDPSGASSVPEVGHNRVWSVCKAEFGGRRAGVAELWQTAHDSVRKEVCRCAGSTRTSKHAMQHHNYP